MWNRTDPRREHNDKSTFKARRSASDGEEHPELKPITFSCEETLGIPPEQIAEQILDIS
jgi:hypothetical protein